MSSHPHLLLLGGFLGAGKTTAIVRLAAHWTAHGRRVAVITNDQGADLVDAGLVRAHGLEGAEVVGGCFCCRFDEFIARADELIERMKPDIILAEPVGSCTDLVNTVIRPLGRLHGDRFRVAPYTVLVDPLRALEMLGGGARSLSEKIVYIYGTQQQEAECLAVSKIDLLDEGQREAIERLLEERFPGVRRILFSARTGEGFEELVGWLEGQSTGLPASVPGVQGNFGEASPERGRGPEPREGGKPCAATEGDRDTKLEPCAATENAGAANAIDYQRYAEGEAELAWLDATLQLNAGAPVDLDASVSDLATTVGQALAARQLAIGHVKMLAWPRAAVPAGQTTVVSIPGDERPAEVSLASHTRADAIELIVNLRVAGDPQAVHEVWQPALHAWIEKWGLEVVEGRGSCFTPGPPVPTHGGEG